MLRKLVLNFSHYSAASLLVTATSFVTFPFLTRVFSVADYGVMNLVSATLQLLGAVGKFGTQHAIIRFESDTRAGRQPFDLKTLFSTTVLGMGSSGLLVALTWAALTQFLPAGWLKDDRVPGLFLLTSVLILLRCLESCLINHLRAEQESRILMTYQVCVKYFGVALIVSVLLLIARSLRGFYAAIIITETLGGLALAVLVFGPRTGRPRPSLRSFSPALYRELLRFGIPMMVGYELAGVILSVGDRYIIQYFLPGDPLGIYAASYNLCQYVQTVCVASLNNAVVPIYMRLWSEKGEAATRQFIDQVLHYYVLLAAPIVAGMAAVGPEFLPFVASQKFASGALIIPYVMAGMAIDGLSVVVGAGLFIHKETRVMMRLVLGGALFNVVLNAALVPRVGLVGAALATLLSYLLVTIAMAISSSRRLRITVPWPALAKGGLLGFLMFEVVRAIHLDGRAATIAARIALGAVVYCASVVCLDVKAREAFRFGLQKLRGR